MAIHSIHPSHPEGVTFVVSTFLVRGSSLAIEDCKIRPAPREKMMSNFQNWLNLNWLKLKDRTAPEHRGIMGIVGKQYFIIGTMKFVRLKVNQVAVKHGH
jgi:hypothetical protein